jgi:hypothetical protein
MSPFLGGFPAVPCESCGVSIRWHSDLHRKLIVGSWLFKVAIAGLFVSLALGFILDREKSALLVALASFALLVSGIFVTATKPNTPFVEVVSDPS